MVWQKHDRTTDFINIKEPIRHHLLANSSRTTRINCSGATDVFLMNSDLEFIRMVSGTGPPTQATGSSRSSAGVGVGMLRGAGESRGAYVLY